MRRRHRSLPYTRRPLRRHPPGSPEHGRRPPSRRKHRCPGWRARTRTGKEITAPTEGASAMNNYPFQQQGSPSSNEIEVRALYQQVLDSWNRRNADAFAASFAEDGEVVGFYGSQMSGRAEIASTRRQTFSDHL